MVLNLALAPALSAAVQDECLAVPVQAEVRGRPVRVWPAAALARRTAPVSDERVQLAEIAPASLLGVIEIPAPGVSDARGQAIAPGRYALRYVVQPPLKDHLDTTPWRDFALLLPLAHDDGRRWSAEDLVTEARRVGGGHPHVFELRKPGHTDAAAAITLRWPGLEAVVLIP